MGRFFAATTLILVLSLTACSTNATSGDTSQGDASEEAQAQTANPFIEVTSVDELSDAVGFSVAFPSSVDGFGEATYVAAIPNDLAEVFLASEDNRFILRKGIASGDEDDITGDYRPYSYMSTQDIDGTTVTLKGGNIDEIFVATWSHDGFGYAVTADSGIAIDQMSQLVAQIINA